MRKLTIAGIIQIGLATLFIYGVFSTSTTPLLMSFCLWTPACWFVGYAVARAGIRVTVATEDMAPARASANGRSLRSVRKQEDFS